ANISAKKLPGSARRQPSPNTSCMLARPRRSSVGPKPSRPTPMPKCRPRRPSADRPKRNGWTPMPPSATVWRVPSAMSTNAGCVTPMTSTPIPRRTGPRAAASTRGPTEDLPFSILLAIMCVAIVRAFRVDHLQISQQRSVQEYYQLSDRLAADFDDAFGPKVDHRIDYRLQATRGVLNRGSGRGTATVTEQPATDESSETRWRPG